MSLWEFSALVDGYLAANGGARTEAPTDEEFEAAIIANSAVRF
ncbi:hypothetical protein [Faunimonas pinastri]|nr:hypothetical protein [Faunimonas pinastri]